MIKESESHMQSYGKLFSILLILLALTGFTVFISRVDLGSANIWVAILVASIKASFVLLYFMHLKYESFLIKSSFLATIGFLAILIGFMFWDIAFR
ncbi:cytochrome c oxidase subunit 4 [Desulfocicer vacuolatum DSM 3385]|uniref:Cytochrome c oxidase subunit 4 n=1 Tax=Desulfocicer vacuolatum DSM 3385 TaxID=1121400 RepID=A0A1W2AGQ0_9BACT|nr:cytochrome C oxidase subunit IV family protein [Desulfocicer vacuolatum]SMC59867.1 cytochrome c oxidase subunit 4 [Desulfocicer vacuolatum DSM 3385]